MTLGPIDWAAPWLSPWRATGEAAAEAVASGVPVHAALNAAGDAARATGATGAGAACGLRDPSLPHAPSGEPLRFVPQEALLAGQAYEQFIFETRTCPTREGLHDFFNGLCWLAMPESKRRLNALQAAEIARDGIGAARGPVRDAITVFDENGALLAAPDPLWEALLARQWRRLFVDLRPLWAQARLVIFGHALLEKLVAPRKDMTAHVWRVPAPAALALPEAGGPGGDSVMGLHPWHAWDAWDAWLAGQLDGARLASKPFTPLPVLGVPGWWPQNEDARFYDDARIFRPARKGP